MRVLELKIPPLPQFITIGHGIWSPGSQHHKRSLQIYDILIVARGAFFMMEEEEAYELGEGGVLVLEPDKLHWGHRQTEVETEVYWLHVSHEIPNRCVQHSEIPWSYDLIKVTDQDLKPSAQYIYVPKFAHLNLQPILPVLNEMVELHRTLSARSALRLHILSAELLFLLQSQLLSGTNSRSYKLYEQIVAYLHSTLLERFDAGRMEAAFNYHFDYLSRCLKQHTGLSPLQYRHWVQIEKAKSLLINTDNSLQAVGEQVGLPEVNYFIRLFRKHTGTTPRKYRASLRLG